MHYLSKLSFMFLLLYEVWDLEQRGGLRNHSFLGKKLEEALPSLGSKITKKVTSHNKKGHNHAQAIHCMNFDKCVFKDEPLSLEHEGCCGQRYFQSASLCSSQALCPAALLWELCLIARESGINLVKPEDITPPPCQLWGFLCCLFVL